MIKAKHFRLEEYLPPQVFKERGEAGWELIDSRLIETNDALRDRFGPMIINTWNNPRLEESFGLRQWSGLRTAEYFYYKDPELTEIENVLNMHRDYNSSYTQHKYGRASDALFLKAPVEEVREYVLENPHEFPYLTALEEGVSWFHGDVRNSAQIKVFGA